MRGLLLLTMLACGSGQAQPKAVGNPNRAVNLGEWCNTLTQTMCVRAGSCIGSIDIAASCTDSAMTSCIAGRPNETPSGHTGGELASCRSTLDDAPCDGYMTAVAAHTECQAR
jgi:hypothetical protein